MAIGSVGRREFIALLGGVAAAQPSLWPSVARAQQPGRVARIGIIDDTPMWEPFRQGLRDQGLVMGRNLALEYRVAGGNPDRLAAAAGELARLPVDVIATYGTPASLAAKAASSTIPIVAIAIGDPVRAGLVPSLARPGGNLTGNTILGPEVAAKRLQLLREAFPAVRSVVYFWNPDNASQLPVLEELRAAAPVLGMTLAPLGARNLVEFDSAFAAMTHERPDALIMGADQFQLLHFDRVLAFLAANRIPALFQNRDQALAGGLMAYGASTSDLFRRAAGYVNRILQGTKPADLPVEQAAKFELIVNLKTAKAMGLAISEAFLLRTDEVIE